MNQYPLSYGNYFRKLRGAAEAAGFKDSKRVAEITKGLSKKVAVVKSEVKQEKDDTPNKTSKLTLKKKPSKKKVSKKKK